MTSIVLLLTLPSLPVGTALISKSDVVLISSFDSIVIDFYAKVGYDLDVYFYRVLCSEVRTFPHVENVTRQLTVNENVQYGIDALYLIEGSQVMYNFTTLERQGHTPYVANISVSNLDVNSKLMVESNLSEIYNLPSMDSLNFYVNSSGENRYFYIQLESFNNSTTLNYTVVMDILKYNITGLSPFICYLYRKNSPCSISLEKYSDGQEICVLASIVQQTDGFVILGYFTYYAPNQVSQRGFGYVMLCCTLLIFILYCVYILWCLCIFCKRKVRRTLSSAPLVAS